MKKKLIIILIALFGFAIILLFLYIYQYQQIVNEGSEISDEYCLKVNPLIIERKNAYLDGFKVLEASGSTEQYLETLDEYRRFTEEYLSEEDRWLKKQEEFMSRWDFKLLTPDNVQKGLDLQLKIRKNEYFSSEIILELFNKVDDKKAKELVNKMIANKDELNKLNAEEEKLWSEPPTNFDIRDYFIRIPESKCPPENFLIPEVNEADISG